jgi:transcriptional regulator with XRE-family HTH domain
MHDRIKRSMKLCNHAFEPDYSSVHGLPMQHDIPQLLRAMMEKLGATQAKLAERLSDSRKNGIKVDQSLVSRWLGGVMPETPKYNRIIEVAADIGVLTDVRSEDIAGDMPEERPRTVKLKGYVGASGEAFYYRLADEDLEEVPAPENANDQTVAVQVRGKSLGPALESWLVYYDDVRSPITPDLHNQLCVVGLADDRLLVKRLERKGGKFVLVSNNGEPDIEDADIEWAAKVTSMKPRT